MTIFATLTVVFGFLSFLLVRKGGVWNPAFEEDINIPAIPPILPTEPSLPVEQPTMPIPAKTPNNATLADFLKWQWQFEKAVPANKNPGNYRFYYGGYLPIYGNVKKSVGGFAMFPTLAQGQMYATTSTKVVIKNHPELTILTYIGGNKNWSGYAPASDNNPVSNYATFIATHLGVKTSFLMKNLVV